jgi:hypothetical protein
MFLAQMSCEPRRHEEIEDHEEVAAVRLAAEGGLPRRKRTQIQTALPLDQRLVFVFSYIAAVGALRAPTDRTALRSSPFLRFSCETVTSVCLR